MTAHGNEIDLRMSAETAAFLRSVSEAAAGLARSLNDVRAAARAAGATFRDYVRAARACAARPAKRSWQMRRAFGGRLPKGWRRHVRRVKAEERRRTRA